MSKKKIMLISSVLLTLILSIVIFNNKENVYNNIISNINKDKQVINSNMITMMYETEAGSGEYTETKDNTWPESGYIFNENLSGCENGGELEYNSGNNTVNLLSNSSDRCYVYFDKYDGVWIDSVVATNVTGSSITLDVSATSENGNITTYYYSLNDSEEYIETTTNPILINDLNKLTEYNIKIYTIDNTGAKSNIYELSVSTTDISVPVINSVSVSNITASGFSLNVNVTSDVAIERYYFYIDGSGENFGGTSTTNNYSFISLDDGVNYNIKVFVKTISGVYSDEYYLEVQTLEKQILLADYIIGLYSYQGSNGIYYHISSLANSAGDNSYRYAGANPNNYVCFGSNVATCPSESLYRIIGVFNREVKLIKATSADKNILGNNGAILSPNSSPTYWNWNSNSDANIWSESNLNTINLNQNFINIIGSTWSNKISTHAWYISGYSSYSVTPKIFYNSESTGTTYNAKVGLMYVSDYGYAASSNYWTTQMNSYNNAINNNWMYSNLNEWTITSSTDYDNRAFIILSRGSVTYDHVNTSSALLNRSVRPVFYLNSDIYYISGTGTQSDPFRIE